MSVRATHLYFFAAALSIVPIASCAAETGPEEVGTGGVGGASLAGAGGTGATTAGTGTAGTGGTAGSGTSTGGAGAGGTATGGSAGAPGGAGAGGASAGAGMGGSAMGGMAGSGVAGSFVGAGTGGTPGAYPLDCGDSATVVEAHGPTMNRVNYVIVGDGYSAEELNTTMDEHIAFAMEKRFSDPIGQVYLRYRKFVNICALKIPSTPICGSSVFGCCGDDQSRLARCDRNAALDAINENIPEPMEVDWRAVVLNGDDWWNTGADLMLWSGGNMDAHGAALHEGGHGFHQLADEYGNCGSNWVNNTEDNQTSGGKWDAWIDYDQADGTHEQGFFACEGNSAYRPSDNSMMNMLFGDDQDTSFNAVSREKMIMDIWRIVQFPWDSVEPAAGAVMNPTTLTLNLIDADVINVDWSVDGNVVAMDGGPVYNVAAAGLASGTHEIEARAYDNAGMDLVRQTTGNQYNRQYWTMNANKTVSWTVTIP